MSIEFRTGNMFDVESIIKVNTTNCVGVMGKGVALEFKKRNPKMFLEYKKSCNEGFHFPGSISVYNSDCKKYFIINFFTKNHWKNPSEYEWIESGLKELKELLYICGSNDIITIPPLGCGNGGLDWKIVKEMIIKYLSNLNIKIIVFEPEQKE